MKHEQRQYKFNDEFVAPKLQALRDLKIEHCIITAEQIQKVTEILELNDNSLEELQAKRNSAVKLLCADKDDQAAWNTMSGVVCVIDSKRWHLCGKK